MVKSYSQKIARVMEIGSYVMMIPASFGVFLTGVLWFIAFSRVYESQDISSIFLSALIPITIIVWGIWLFVYYFKHSRGKLAERKVKNMWISTLVFNVPLSFVSVFSSVSIVTSIRALTYEVIAMAFSSFIIVIWHVTTVTLAINVLGSIKNSDNVR
jgi:hypothetical protein